MSYTPIFTKPYADGYKNKPNRTTPVTAEIKNKETETLLAIEAYLAELQIPEKLSELTNDEGFIKNTVSNLANYYLKSETYARTETYTREEVQALIAAAVSSVAGKLNMEVVDSLPVEGISTTTFYLLPKETAEEKNVYDEYINTDGTTSGWELIGGISTSIDLSNYYSKSETDALVEEKTTQIADDINNNLSQLEYSEFAGGKNLTKIIKYATQSGTYKYLAVGNVYLEKGKTYTMSFTATSNGIGRIYIPNAVGFTNNSHVFVIDSTTIRCKKTAIAVNGNDGKNKVDLLVTASDNEGTVTITDIQFEEGTQATNYEPYIPSVKMLAEEVSAQNESLSVVGKCKNLLNPSHLGTTVMGITCTNNGDGTYALNGTATADLDLRIKGFKNLQLNKKYKMLGCPSGGSDSTYMLYDSNESDIKDIGKGKVYTPTKQPNINIRIMNGVTVNNLVFKPMLTTNLSATYDDFVPYTGDGETLTADVAELKNDLGGLSFSVSGTTLSITNGTNTWTLSQ